MKTGILFDLDGTLLNTLEDLVDATNYALAAFGHPPRTLKEVRRFIGNGAENLIRLSLPDDHKEDLQQVLAVYKPYYTDHCQIKTKPYDGVLPALKTLGEKYPVAIVSNKPDAAVKALCADYSRACMHWEKQPAVPGNLLPIWCIKPWKSSVLTAVSMWATAKWMC